MVLYKKRLNKNKYFYCNLMMYQYLNKMTFYYYFFTQLIVYFFNIILLNHHLNVYKDYVKCYVISKKNYHNKTLI